MNASRGTRISGPGRLPARAVRAIMVLVIASFVAGSIPNLAQGETSERKLMGVTKTTVYGALLGGLLGLTSALVVRDSARDDVIRWGVALGALAGFAYGISSMDRDAADLSLRSVGRAASTWEGGGRVDRAAAVHEWRLGCGRVGVSFAEVSHDRFQEDIRFQRASAGQGSALGNPSQRLAR